MKKLIWTALAALASAAAAGLAMRVLNFAWGKLMKEPPPEQPRWARFLVGAPLKKGVQKTVEPAVA